ncbi:hypothetical protein [Marinicellulosiphila megalodicopiae]|uniref:hypothetical protein n=1 Tax=Marinicellulosiphila megalodicopiae TaxID=2724896 RepID=UPI003BB04968
MNQNNALLETFKSNGLIKLKNALNKNDVSTLQKNIWKEIYNKLDIELAKPETHEIL